MDGPGASVSLAAITASPVVTTVLPARAAKTRAARNVNKHATIECIPKETAVAATAATTSSGAGSTMAKRSARSLNSAEYP